MRSRYRSRQSKSFLLLLLSSVRLQADTKAPFTSFHFLPRGIWRGVSWAAGSSGVWREWSKCQTEWVYCLWTICFDDEVKLQTDPNERRTIFLWLSCLYERTVLSKKGTTSLKVNFLSCCVEWSPEHSGLPPYYCTLADKCKTSTI